MYRPYCTITWLCSVRVQPLLYNHLVMFHTCTGSTVQSLGYFRTCTGTTVQSLGYIPYVYRPYCTITWLCSIHVQALLYNHLVMFRTCTGLLYNHLVMFRTCTGPTVQSLGYVPYVYRPTVQSLGYVPYMYRPYSTI